jgi:hypothetical protein
MKHTIKTLLGLFTISCIFLLSCQDDEKTAYNLHTEAENIVPYVRVLLENSTVDSSVLDTAVINGSVSAPSSNVSTWSARVRITGSITTEFVDVINISTFPSSFKLSITEIATALNVELADIQPADVIEFSGVSKGANDVELTYENLAGDLSGQPEQNQAYKFSVVVFCAPVATNFVGDWTLNLIDLYGDGWDGAFILATVDGEETEYTVDGAGTIHTVTIPSGTTSLVWSYTSGSYEEEHEFTITDPSNTTYGPFNGGTGIPFCFL